LKGEFMGGLRVLALALVCSFVLAAATGCKKASAQTVNATDIVPPINTVVTISLRGDVFPQFTVVPPSVQTPSAATGAAIPPQPGVNTITGTLSAISDHWIVIATNSQDFWVPRELVTMIQVPH
jgi:hypothetical protein